MATHAQRTAVARNTVGFVLVGASASVYALATVPLLTRWLSPAEWGFFAALSQVNSLIQFAALALFSQSLLKFYVEYEESERRRFVGTLFVAIFAFQLVLLSSLFVTRELSLRALFANLTLPLDPTIAWSCLWFFAAPLRVFCYSVLRIQERVRALLFMNIMHGLLMFPALAVLVGVRGTGITGAVQAMAFAEWVSLAIALAVVARDMRISLVGGYLARCTRFATPLLAGTLIVVLVNNLDRIALSRYVDLAALGVYSVGAMVGNSLALVVSAATTSSSTRIIKVLWNEGVQPAGALVSATAADMVVLVGVPFALLCLTGDAIVEMLGRSGIGWTAASAVAVGVASGHFMRGLYVSAQNVLFYCGKTTLLLLNNLLLLAIALVLAPFLAARGPLAVGWLLASCFALLAPITYTWARKFMPIRVEVRGLLIPGIGILGCAGIAIHSSLAGMTVAAPVWWLSRTGGLVLLAATCALPLYRLLMNRARR